VKNRLVETSHLCHLRVGMKWVAIVAKSVEKGLVWSRLLFFDHIGCTFGDGRINSFDCSFVSKATNASDKQACSDHALKLTFIIFDIGINHHHGSLPFVLEVNHLLTNGILCVELKRIVNCDFFFAVEQHHGVEGGHSRYVEVATREWPTMTYRQGIGWESLEVISIFIAELEVFFVHGVLLEAN